MSDDALALLAATAAAFTALVFARAAWHKIADFTAFTGFVADYRIVPESQVRTASMALVAAEVAIPVTLLIPGLQPVGAALAVLLLGLYAAAMGINILRGRTSIECGCGGAATLLSPTLLVRNGVLALIAASVLFGNSMTLTFGEAVAAVGLAFLMWATFLLVEQILANGMHARQAR